MQYTTKKHCQWFELKNKIKKTKADKNNAFRVGTCI